MRFDLIDLRLFLAVVDAGSLTGGAAQANLSLSAASERVREMEARSGVRLLDRGRRGVTPTEAGEAVAHHAREILRQMARLHGELSDRAKTHKATIRVAANTAAVAEHLPEPLGRWLAANPQIEVDLKERQSVQTVRAVSDGVVDVGVISDAVDAAGLSVLPFVRDPLVVISAPNHPMAGGPQRRFDEVLGSPMIGLTLGALQEHLDAQAAALGRAITYRARVGTFEGVCCMVAAGAGLGVISEPAARRWAGRVKATPLSDPWAERRLQICFRSAAELSPSARDLVGHLTAHHHDAATISTEQVK